MKFIAIKVHLKLCIPVTIISFSVIFEYEN